MATIPFSADDLLYTNISVCDRSNLSEIEIEQCKNAQLGKWYVDNLAHNQSVPIKLNDLEAQYTVEQIRAWNLVAGIVGLTIIYFRLNV